MDEKINRIKSEMKKIREDIDSLKSKGELTERGRGQLDIVEIIEEILND